MNQNILSDPARLKALHELDLLADEPSETLDRLTRLASQLTQSPCAFVSILDEDRQFFKSHYGFSGPRETPISVSICQHVVISGEPLIVSDAREHELLKDIPGVKNQTVVAYAGMPLMFNGMPLGSFCIMDRVPRDWNHQELAMLKDLAEAALVEFELRDTTAKLVKEKRFREDATDLIVHDLKSPLTAVLAAADTAKWSHAEKEELLSIIQANAERMLILVNQLLDVAQFQGGSLTPQLEPADLAELVRESVTELSPVSREHSIDIEVEPVKVPLVNADREMIKRVVVNLLSNALKFSPKGSTIRIGLQAAPDGFVTCLVADSGPGIPADKVDHIFSKFGRIEGVKSNSQVPSTGLGLTYCKLCIDAHGGRIGVQSTPGEGSTFWFSLCREVGK